MPTVVYAIIMAFWTDFRPAAVEVTFADPADMAMVLDPFRGIRRADGSCHHAVSIEDIPGIFLNKEIWHDTNEWQKRELVYHELGHCLLGLDHVEGANIMNGFAPNRFWVESDGSNWSELVQRMKAQVNK